MRYSCTGKTFERRSASEEKYKNSVGREASSLEDIVKKLKCHEKNVGASIRLIVLAVI